MDIVIILGIAAILIIGGGFFGHELLKTFRKEKPAPKTPEQLEREKIAVALMLKGATFDAIRSATGFSEKELDKAMQDNGRAFVVWMLIRDVDVDTMLRRSPYSARGTLAIGKEWWACKKEGREFLP